MRARRNSFARESYIPTVAARASDPGSFKRSCAWCGCNPAPRRPLYTVTVSPDSNNRDSIIQLTGGGDALFCSWQDAEAYTGSEFPR